MCNAFASTSLCTTKRSIFDIVKNLASIEYTFSIRKTFIQIQPVRFLYMLDLNFCLAGTSLATCFFVVFFS